jgi:hypothetical protein
MSDRLVKGGVASPTWMEVVFFPLPINRETMNYITVSITQHDKRTSGKEVR